MHVWCPWCARSAHIRDAKIWITSGVSRPGRSLHAEHRQLISTLSLRANHTPLRLGSGCAGSRSAPLSIARQGGCLARPRAIRIVGHHAGQNAELSAMAAVERVPGGAAGLRRVRRDYQEVRAEGEGRPARLLNPQVYSMRDRVRSRTSMQSRRLAS